jgi:hypothetical protein
MCLEEGNDVKNTTKPWGNLNSEDSCDFNVHGSVHRSNILVYKSQQDAEVTEFILSEDCSTCFGGHYHPSLGAQNNCNYSICSYSCFVLLKMGDSKTRNM